MSGVSVNQGKGDKNSKSKYSAFKINDLFKGKTEIQQRNPITKHGYQSLGKVVSTRRIPPPPNLPSLKSENCGNDPNINLVPAGGQGWGSSKDQPGSGSEPPAKPSAPSASAATPAPAAAVPPPTVVAAAGAPPAVPPQPPAAAAVAAARVVAPPSSEKSWSSVTSGPPDAGPAPSYLAHQSPYFQQEFPSLRRATPAAMGLRRRKPSSGPTRLFPVMRLSLLAAGL
ncbi:protein PRRC2A-like [Pollicipes pollicipes]|uniref:protein PRRC2A-like n=1 Tax=Pollicipes pollicipes TaxID=41117 RepID=UPI001884C418|nr:protein PRRC2A-like [Pollicipes pollicipes]